MRTRFATRIFSATFQLLEYRSVERDLAGDHGPCDGGTQRAGRRDDPLGLKRGGFAPGTFFGVGKAPAHPMQFVLVVARSEKMEFAAQVDDSTTIVFYASL